MKIIPIKPQLIYQSDKVEIRKYQPCWRSVSICSRLFHLPMPYSVFAIRKHHKFAIRKHHNDQMIYFGLAKESDEVYFPPFCHINTAWCVCSMMGDEFARSGALSFEQMVADFWQSNFGHSTSTYFARGYRSLRRNYGYYSMWQKMTPQESLNALRYDSISMAEFIENVKEKRSATKMLRIYDEEMADGYMPIPEDE